MRENALERLRKLNAYRLEGSLSFEAYREERGALLDDFETRAANYAATVRPNMAAIEEAERIAGVRRRRSRIGVFAAAGTVALIGVPLAFLFLQSLGPDVTEEAIRQTPNMNRPLKLLSRFMGRNDWSRTSIERFLAAWHELDESERRMIRDGRVFKSFTDSLQARARQQRARAGTNAAAVLPLEAFAAELGVAIPLTLPQAGPEKSFADADNQSRKAAARPSPPGQAATEPETTTPVETAEPLEAVPAGIAAVASPSSVAPAAVATPESPASIMPGPKKPSEAPNPCSGVTPSGDQRSCAEELTDDVYGPLMVVVEPPGGKPFMMSQWEVTYQEFNLFCRWESRECPRSVWGNDDAPVVLVSWADAVAYAGWLSWLTGAEYRLPTENEWELAAAYVETVAPELLEEAGRLRTPSPRDISLDRDGLMHLGGNVQEWVARAGEYSASLSTENRTVRGGCYADDRESLSPSITRSVDGVTADRCTGFRVVRAMPAEASAGRR